MSKIRITFPALIYRLLDMFLQLLCSDMIPKIMTFSLFSFQINMLLNFKDEKQECPCPEDIREQLLDFHDDLMRHCGKQEPSLHLMLKRTADAQQQSLLYPISHPCITKAFVCCFGVSTKSYIVIHNVELVLVINFLQTSPLKNLNTGIAQTVCELSLMYDLCLVQSWTKTGPWMVTVTLPSEVGSCH